MSINTYSTLSQNITFQRRASSYPLVAYVEQRKTNLHPNTLNTENLHIILKTSDLIKLRLVTNLTWSSGMLAESAVHSSLNPNLSYLNYRKSWGVWSYSVSVFWNPSNQYQLQRLDPWSIRVRRAYKLVAPQADLTVINFSFNKFTTPSKRVKRWLKKKYTTQSWR